MEFIRISSETKERHHIDDSKAVIKIGRSLSNNICLDVGSVSREHCYFYPGPQTVRDDASKNGTYILRNGLKDIENNYEELPRDKEIPSEKREVKLNDGDVLRLGMLCKLEFRVQDKPTK